MSNHGISPRQRRRIVARRVQQHIREITTPRTLNFNSPLNQENNSFSESSDAEINEADSIQSSSTEEDTNTCRNLLDLKDQLRIWAISNNITGIACQSLLNTLREHQTLKFLPVDHRTLLARKSSIVKRDIEGGVYCHLGIQKKC